LEDWTEVGSVVAGRELMPPKGSLPIRPRASALATLQRLHSATAHIAETAPELIQNPEVARGLEQGLIHATVDCLSPLSPREGTIAQRHHTKIMMQFRKMLEEHADKAVYVPELCAAIGVSDRTLRLCFQEHLGISPKRYLFLRRMTFAKRALRDANPTSTNVTEIAMQLGFWELGRFAVAYRSLFGELPSTTLRQAPQ
jgi:transcriptional regulator GlxA family with amidase domain